MAVNPNTDTVVRYLSDVTFPATRQDLVDCAIRHNADQEVLDLLNGLPDEDFPDMAAVRQWVGVERSY